MTPHIAEGKGDTKKPPVCAPLSYMLQVFSSNDQRLIVCMTFYSKCSDLLMLMDYAGSYENKCICFVLVPVHGYSALMESKTTVSSKLTLAMHDVVNVNFCNK